MYRIVIVPAVPMLIAGDNQAEMLDEENMAWGSPPSRRNSRLLSIVSACLNPGGTLVRMVS